MSNIQEISCSNKRYTTKNLLLASIACNNLLYLDKYYSKLIIYCIILKLIVYGKHVLSYL